MQSLNSLSIKLEKKIKFLVAENHKYIKRNKFRTVVSDQSHPLWIILKDKNTVIYIWRFVGGGKPRILDFGVSTFKAFNFLFFKSICKGIESLLQTMIF